MTELATLRTFYRFNSTVRRNYLEAILGLPEDERLKDRGASYPSLQEIFVHVLDGLRFWFEYVPEDRVARSERLPARSLGPSDLRRWTERADRTVSKFLDPLGPGDLAREIVGHFPADGKEVEERFPTGDILWHMVEEELQHRGELNALFWQMDIDPPVPNVDVWNACKAPGMFELFPTRRD